MNLTEAHKNFTTKINYPVPTLVEKEALQIGTLNLNNEAVAFVADYNFIFGNKLVVASCCNDRWTAIDVFATAMKMTYGNKFTRAE